VFKLLLLTDHDKLAYAVLWLWQDSHLGTASTSERSDSDGGVVGKEVSRDMKDNSVQGRRQHGQKKVILPGKGSLMFRVAIAHNSPQTIEITGCLQI
jgi:hypothetical protein